VYIYCIVYIQIKPRHWAAPRRRLAFYMRRLSIELERQGGNPDELRSCMILWSYRASALRPRDPTHH
jgi:hypothetical protein